MKPSSLSTPRSSFPFYPFPASYSFLFVPRNEPCPRGYPIHRVHSLFNPPSLIKDQRSPHSFRGKITKRYFNSIKTPGCRQSSIPIPARVTLRFSFDVLFTAPPSSFILHNSAFPIPSFVFPRFQKKCTLFVPPSFFSNNEPPARRTSPVRTVHPFTHTQSQSPDYLITLSPYHLITLLPALYSLFPGPQSAILNPKS
jgi:hypothetical protein